MGGGRTFDGRVRPHRSDVVAATEDTVETLGLAFVEVNLDAGPREWAEPMLVESLELEPRPIPGGKAPRAGADRRLDAPGHRCRNDGDEGKPRRQERSGLLGLDLDRGGIDPPDAAHRNQEACDLACRVGSCPLE